MARRSRSTRSLLSILALLIGLSVFEYVEQGRLVWPSKLFDAARDAYAELQEPAAPADSVPTGTLSGRVSKVTDGDTFRLIVAGADPLTVRLYGIDAPERDQPYGNEATIALSGWIDGRDVTVVVEDVDRYGRLVGRVFVDGHDINLAMVREGRAWWYVAYAPDALELSMAYQQARSAHLGLWASGTAIAPWEWRRR